jgi:hypothetical protein
VIDDGVLEAHGDDAAGDLGLVPSPVPAGKDAGEDQFAKNTFANNEKLSFTCKINKSNGT